jgi:hypothetical protein
MQRLATCSFILFAVVVTLLVVADATDAQSTAPLHWNRYDTGGADHTPYVLVNNTRFLASHLNDTQLSVLESTNRGVNWTRHNVLDTPDKTFSFLPEHNFTTIHHENSRTVVTWLGSGLGMMTAYSDDLVTWSYANATFPVGSVTVWDLYLDTQDHWFVASLHADGNNIRVVIRETSNAGGSWNTLQNFVLENTASGAKKSFNVVWGQTDQKLVLAANWATGGGVRTNEVWWTANRGGLWNHEGLNGDDNVEGHITIGKNGDTWFASTGRALGSPELKLYVKPCLSASCSTFQDVGTSGFETTFVTTKPNYHALSGLAIDGGYGIYRAGVAASSGQSGSTDLSFELLENNGTTAVAEDLVDPTDVQCFGRMLADNSPSFACDGMFYIAQPWYLPEEDDVHTGTGDVFDVDTHYDLTSNFLVSDVSQGSAISQNSAAYTFLNSRAACTDEGFSDPTGAHEMAMTVQSEFMQYCAASGSQRALWFEDFASDPRSVQMANISFCNIEAFTKDYAVGLSCDGSLAVLFDPFNGRVRQTKSVLGGVDIDVARTSGGQWVVADTQGFKVYSSTGVLLFDNNALSPEAVAIEETLWVADGNTLYHYALDGTLMATVSSSGGSTVQGQMKFSKDKQYVYRLDAVRLWVLNATDGSIVGRTADRIDDSGWIPGRMDVDFLNNYAYLLEVAGPNSTVTRFPIHRFTESLAGDGGSGLNPDITNDLNPYNGTMEFGAVSGFQPGTGSGTLFGDTDDLDSAFGGSGSGRAFVGILLVLALSISAAVSSGIPALGFIGAGLGVVLATVMGLFGPWVPVLFVVVGGAFIVARLGGGGG